MRRLSASIIATLLLVGLCAPATFAAAPAGTTAVPKVVFIVGPSGSATDRYRAQARAAAAIARQYTPDVVELYSPDATWPAVKRAVAGASLVVYMGHGNGWPSRYRDSLFPATQNGFGLNPTAGGGDATHQYFGEAAVGSQLTLAKNAVVLLNHLCYASGLSEPGLAEGTIEQARQRVDNYAAGFIRAGAAAVIAEAYSSPSYFVKAVLGDGRSIQSAWLRSPSANGNRLAFESQRSPGYVAQMDTEAATSGFTRSIVMKAGLAPADVLAGASGSATALPVGPLTPNLSGIGIQLAAPDIAGLPAAGTAMNVDVPFTIKNRKALPAGLQASVRWDPIAVPVVAAEPATETQGAAPAASPTASPTADPLTTEPPDPTATAAQPDDPDAVQATPSPAAPPVSPRGREYIDAPTDAIDLVTPERAGDVVSPAAVKIGQKSLQIPVTLPTVPGRYRLSITFHDADGVAYDAASQALVPSLVVRVTGDFDGAIQAVSTAQLIAGSEVYLGVRVVNLGKTAWGHGKIETPSSTVKVVPAAAASLVGRWLPLSGGAALPTDVAAQSATTDLPIGLAPGTTLDTAVGLKVPAASGEYLLVLDVVTPDHGSLVASGAEPTLVRVTVSAAK